MAARMNGSIIWDGIVDEVGVWGSVLSGGDITSIYNSGTPADLASFSPLSWWMMGDSPDTISTFYDRGSEGNDATPTWAEAGDIVNETPKGYGGTMTNMTSGDIVEDVPS